MYTFIKQPFCENDNRRQHLDLLTQAQQNNKTYSFYINIEECNLKRVFEFLHQTS